MKKYLTSATVAIVFCGLFAGCHDDVIDNTNLGEAKKTAFAENFVKFYGEINPNQDWGFGSASSVRTRGSNPNGEWWGRSVGGGGLGLEVPAPLTSQQKDKVRRYFQQHQKPGGTNCEAMSSYFVQHVYTGATNVTNSQTIEKYINSGGTLEAGSSHMDRYVAGSMHEHLYNFNATNATAIDVWDGISYQDGYTLTGNETEDYNHKKSHTDQIMLMTSVDTQSFGWYNSDASLEVNDHYRLVSGDVIQAWDSSTTINGENSNVSGMMFVGFDFEGRLPGDYVYKVEDTDNPGLYYWGGNANMATYREAKADDPVERVAYFQGKVGGNNKQYYIGAADGYYSDWIVRIVKATSDNPSGGNETTTGGTVTKTNGSNNTYLVRTVIDHGRIFCEDLGQSSEKKDYDYNDVVFDAKNVEEYKKVTDANGTELSRTSTTYKTEITLLAAGGELTISVADENVHSKFNLPDNYMINTFKEGQGLNGAKHSEGELPVTFVANEYYEKFVDIPIKVKIYNYAFTTLAEKGEAPHKFRVPVGTRWAYERTPIDEAYTTFSNWVGQPNETPWSTFVREKLYPELSGEETTDSTGLTTTTLIDNTPAEYVVSITSNETEIWSGENNLLNYNSGNVVITEGLSNVKQNSVIRIYGDIINSGGGWSVQMTDNSWANRNTYHLIKDGNNSSEFANPGYIEATIPSAAVAQYFVSNGLVIWGNNFKVLKVTIDNTNTGSGSQDPEDPPLVQVEGTPLEYTGGGLTDVYIDATTFSNSTIKGNDVIYIYATVTNTYWYVNVLTNNWDPLNVPNYDSNKITGDNDLMGLYNTTKQRIELPTNNSTITAMKKTGLHLQIGNNINISAVTFASN